MQDIENTFENVVKIVPFGTVNKFSQDEAERLVKVLYNLTSKTKKKLNILNSQAPHYRGRKIQDTQYDEQLNKLVESWSEKIRRLGCFPMDIFLVRIPSETADFYWEFPDTQLKFEV